MKNVIIICKTGELLKILLNQNIGKRNVFNEAYGKRVNKYSIAKKILIEKIMDRIESGWKIFRSDSQRARVDELLDLRPDDA